MPKSTVATVTTTAAIVVTSYIGGQTAYLHSASGTLYVGGSDLTAANGYKLDNGDKITIHVGNSEALYAITSTGTATLYMLTQID